MCVSAFVNRTVEGKRLGEGENGDVPAVVIDVCIHKGQVAAVVNEGLHLRHIGIDGFVVDGAQQHTPAVQKAIPPGTEKHTLVAPAQKAVTPFCTFRGFLAYSGKQ